MRRAAGLGMDRAALWTYLGFLHRDPQRVARSRGRLQPGAGAHPWRREGLALRGTVRVEAGRWAEAAGDFERALQLAGRKSLNGDGVDWRAAPYAWLGAGEVVRYRRKCATELERAVTVGDNVDGSLLLACCIIPLAVEDYGQLLAWTKRACDNGPNSSTRADYGMVLYRAGKFAEAAP